VIPIADTKARVIGVCAGSPDDPSWFDVHTSLASAIDTARESMRFSKKDLKHRRADTLAGAVGVSFGGGQAVSSFSCLANLNYG
jgi:hypothetical protein